MNQENPSNALAMCVCVYIQIHQENNQLDQPFLLTIMFAKKRKKRKKISQIVMTNCDYHSLVNFPIAMQVVINISDMNSFKKHSLS